MLKIIILILALSMDTFLISENFGSNKIKINIPTSIVISLASALSLCLSISLSNILSKVIPIYLFNILSFFLLITIGSYNIFSFAIKKYLKNMQIINKNVNKKDKKENLIINVFIDETKADINHSNNLDIKESFLIGILGSIDSICAGLSFPYTNIFIVFILTFFICFSLIITGFKTGNVFSETSKINLSWFSGILLIILAFTKIM